MSEIPGTDPRVKEIIQGLGINLENLKEVHIHIVPDNVVYADALYIINAGVEVDPSKLSTVLKRYRLEEYDPLPFKIGKKVRIKPEFERNDQVGRLYYLTVLEDKMAVIKWDNLTHPDSKPFRIELGWIEMVR